MTKFEGGFFVRTFNMDQFTELEEIDLQLERLQSVSLVIELALRYGHISKDSCIPAIELLHLGLYDLHEKYKGVIYAKELAKGVMV